MRIDHETQRPLACAPLDNRRVVRIAFERLARRGIGTRPALLSDYSRYPRHSCLTRLPVGLSWPTLRQSPGRILEDWRQHHSLGLFPDADWRWRFAAGQLRQS